MLGPVSAALVTALCLVAGAYATASALRVRRHWPRSDNAWHALAAVVMIVTAWVMLPKAVSVVLSLGFLALAGRYVWSLIAGPAEECHGDPSSRAVNGYHAAMMLVMAFMLGGMGAPANADDMAQMPGMEHMDHAIPGSLSLTDPITLVAGICALAAAVWIGILIGDPTNPLRVRRASAQAAMAAAMAIMVAAH